MMIIILRGPRCRRTRVVAGGGEAGSCKRQRRRRLCCICKPQIFAASASKGTLAQCMPIRAVTTPTLMSSDDDGDGGGAAWISAKDAKEARESRCAEAFFRVALVIFI
jgi:hypothetical protein